MRCTDRHGQVSIVDKVNLKKSEVHWIKSNDNFGDYGTYNEDLTNGTFTLLDIMKIEDVTADGLKVIWKRPVKKYYIYVKLYYFGGLYDEGHLVNLSDDSIKMFNSRRSAEVTMNDIIENLRDGYKVEYEIKEEIK